MLWRRIPTEGTSLKSVKITPLNMPSFYRKSCESHQAQNNKFLLEKMCPDVVHDFPGFMTEPVQEIMKKVVDMEKKKKRWGVKGFKIWILVKFKSRHHSRGINR